MFKEFCNEMLTKFDSKADTLGDNWKSNNYSQIHELLRIHIDKYMCHYNKVPIGGSDLEQFQQELIDIANYCCMLYTKFENYK